MTQRSAIRGSLLLNFFVLLFVVCMTVVFRDEDSRYFRFGPGADLHVVSVIVNTWQKYVAVVVSLAAIGIADVVVGEVGMPVLSFTVYNPDKLVITEFGKLELQLLANAMYTTSSIRSVFMLIISVTQVDLAIISVIVKEATSVITIRWLLNKKKFRSHSAAQEEEDVTLIEVTSE